MLRFQESRHSARSLGWEALPVLGADRERRRYRARAWRAMLAGCGLFWLLVAAAIWAV